MSEEPIIRKLQNLPTGDRGQRYEVRCQGYPEPGDNVIGWAIRPERAFHMASSILQAPGAVSVTVIDRERANETQGHEASPQAEPEPLGAMARHA